MSDSFSFLYNISKTRIFQVIAYRLVTFGDIPCLELQLSNSFFFFHTFYILDDNFIKEVLNGAQLLYGLIEFDQSLVTVTDHPFKKGTCIGSPKLLISPKPLTRIIGRPLPLDDGPIRRPKRAISSILC